MTNTNAIVNSARRTVFVSITESRLDVKTVEPVIVFMETKKACARVVAQGIVFMEIKNVNAKNAGPGVVFIVM